LVLWRGFAEVTVLSDVKEVDFVGKREKYLELFDV